MSIAPSSPQAEGGRWAVDVRVHGGVTVAKASVDDVLVVLLTDAGDRTPAELRRRIRELVQDAYQAPGPTLGRRSIPPVMQRVVRSLVEWAEETERDAPEVAWWSLAFLHSTSTPMVAHVGGEEPRLEAGTESVVPQSLLLRGEAGLEARALCLRPGHLPAVLMTWTSGSESAAGATVEAEWLLEPREIEDGELEEDPTPGEAETEGAIAIDVGAVPDEATEAETATEAAPVEAPADEAPVDEAVTDEAVADEAVAPEAVSVEAVGDGTFEVAPDESFASEAPAVTGTEAEAVEEQAPEDEAPVTETFPGESLPDTSPAAETVERGWLDEEVVGDEAPAVEAVTDEGAPAEASDTGSFDWTAAPDQSLPVDAEPVSDEPAAADEPPAETIPGEAPEHEAPSAESFTDESSSRETVSDELLAPVAESDQGLAFELLPDEVVPDEERLDEAFPNDAEPSWGDDHARVDTPQSEILDAILADSDEIPGGDYDTSVLATVAGWRRAEPTETEEPADRLEPAQPLEPGEPMHPVEPTESVEQAGMAESAETTDLPTPAELPEAAKRSQSVELSETPESREAVEAAESAESVEPQETPVESEMPTPPEVPTETEVTSARWDLPEAPPSMEEPSSAAGLEESRPGISWSSFGVESAPPVEAGGDEPERRPTTSPADAESGRQPHRISNDPSFMTMADEILDGEQTTTPANPAVDEESVAPSRDVPASEAASATAPSAPTARPEPSAFAAGAPATMVDVPDEWLKSRSAKPAPRPARSLAAVGATRAVGPASPATAPSPSHSKPQRPIPQRPRLQHGRHSGAASHTTHRTAFEPWQARATTLAKQRPTLVLLGILLIVVLAFALFKGGQMLGGGVDLPREAAPPAEIQGPVAGNGAVVPDVATGSVEIKATLVDDDGTKVAKGAEVWVDGEPRGPSPLTVDLPSGPHSFRVSHAGRESPVSVIELAAGGTQAIDFRFGKGDPPRLRLVGQQQPSLLDPVVAITVYLGRVSSEEVKDISLSLEEGGVWRQIPMTLIPAPGGTAGVVMVSSELLRPPHAVPYYVTATRSSTGERFFTEIQNSSNRQ